MVDIDRIMAELDALASQSDAPAPAVTRVLYTEADLAGRAFIKELCTEAGLVGPRRPDRQHVRALGRPPSRPGTGRDGLAHRRDPALRPVRRHGRGPGRTGGDSHVATAGFRAGAADRALDVHQRGADAVRHRLPGEPGTLPARWRPSRWPRCGTRTDSAFDELRRRPGFRASWRRSGCPADYFAAFVELHIEQGPLLERAGIADRRRHGHRGAGGACASRWQGEGGHAGAVLMPGRRDALLRRRRSRAGRRGRGTIERRPRHRRDHGRLPRPPRGDQQHPRPGDSRDRRPRHRSGPPRSGPAGDPGAIDAIAARRQVAAVVECLNCRPARQHRRRRRRRR